MRGKVSLMTYQIDRELGFDPNLSRIVYATINPHSFITAERDSQFRKALKAADYLVADGVGTVLAAGLRLQKVPRITGSEVFAYLMGAVAALPEPRVFFLGSSPETIARILDRAHSEYPRLSAAGYAPPFVPVFSDEQNDEMIRTINAFRPDLLCVGMTAPKQETWVYENLDRLDVRAVCSIGAVFDFYAQTKQRSNPMMVRLGLEWLGRLVREPSRLWRRNLVSTPKFLARAFQVWR